MNCGHALGRLQFFDPPVFVVVPDLQLLHFGFQLSETLFN
jgi:hypothetical protein